MRACMRRRARAVALRSPGAGRTAAPALRGSAWRRRGRGTTASGRPLPQTMRRCRPRQRRARRRAAWAPSGLLRGTPATTPRRCRPGRRRDPPRGGRARSSPRRATTTAPLARRTRWRRLFPAACRPPARACVRSRPRRRCAPTRPGRRRRRRPATPRQHTARPAPPARTPRTLPAAQRTRRRETRAVAPPASASCSRGGAAAADAAAGARCPSRTSSQRRCQEERVLHPASAPKKTMDGRLPYQIGARSVQTRVSALAAAAGMRSAAAAR